MDGIKGAAIIIIGTAVVVAVIAIGATAISNYNSSQAPSSEPCLKGSVTTESVVDGQVTETGTLDGCMTSDGVFHPAE